MSTYLERYLAGEYEQVWAELLALGATVRDEPLYSDALSVARETMTRARYNVELIVGRLSKNGYEPAPAHILPQPDVEETIATLEKEAGPLPLSLRLWFSIVGEVSLSGSHPSWKVCGNARICRKGYLRLFAKRLVATEPLVVYDAEQRSVEKFVPNQHLSADYVYVPSPNSHIVFIAPDVDARSGFGSDGWEGVIIDGWAADGWITGSACNEIEETFTQYLRRSFQWGGFPGFANVPGELRPTTMLKQLTEGLLAI